MAELKIKQNYQTGVNLLYEAWTKPQNLCKWFGPDAIFQSKVGSRYQFSVAYGGKKRNVSGQVLSLCENKNLSLSWKWDDEASEIPPSRCDITFSGTDKVSKLELVHDLTENDNACYQGWNFVLRQLAATIPFNYDWSQFQTETKINKPLSEIAKLWFTSEGLEKWFLSASMTTRNNQPLQSDQKYETGDRFSWTWCSGDNVTGKMLEVKSNELLKFSFGDNGEGQDVIVKVEFLEQNSITQIKIHQSQMAATDRAKVSWHMECHNCWSLILHEMKLRLENNLDINTNYIK